MSDSYKSSHEFTIVSYMDNGDYHRCKDENGLMVNLDILTCGSIKIAEDDDYKEFCKSLVGKKVSVDYTHTYLHMAANPKICG